MGRGVALAIRNKWPKVYQEYRKEYKKKQLGNIQVVGVGPELFVINLFAQYNYGLEKRHTNYSALKSCLETVSLWEKERDLDNYIPYKMGCGNAGGSWEKVSAIIDMFIPKAIIVHK